jgi:carbonic anhydrase/acetyltransferase-like protein (isoleucine patch superfamily)
MNQLHVTMLCGLLLTFVASLAQAEVLSLQGRLPATPGGTDYQAYYDPNLDITWAADVKINGLDTWVNQVAWASQLVLGGVGNWRLPYISVAAGAGPFIGTPVNCSTASESECKDNELGYMFYHNLSGQPGFPIIESDDPDLALFPRLRSGRWWSGTGFAWSFSFSDGSQGVGSDDDHNWAWAVHDGDVPALVDETATVADDAVISDGSTIGANAVIKQKVVVGIGSTIGADVTIDKETQLGGNSVVGNGSKISKNVVAGDDLTVGTNVTIHKDVVIGTGVTIGDNTEIHSGTVIGNNAMIGMLNGGIGVFIGNRATIGAGSSVGDGEVIPNDTVYP